MAGMSKVNIRRGWSLGLGYSGLQDFLRPKIGI